MQFEAWWLLAIPLFFGLGWLASRLDARSLQREHRRLPDAYFKGLNFLLNEQPDKAIDAFVDVVRLDPDTVELHFALGNLFRRRGETDRAIRVHQNLAQRTDLGGAQRDHAMYELGQDYLRAGLLDRAEDVFNRLEGSAYGAAALHHRLDIAQQVRDWPLAIELAGRAQADGDENLQRRVGHFHCELAAQALGATGAGRLEAASRELTAALRADPLHPRAHLLSAEVALAEADAAAAIRAWSEVARSSPAHLALVADGWLQAHRTVGLLDQGIATLEKVLHETPSVDGLSALIRARTERDGAAAALAWARGALREHPSLLGLEMLLELRARVLADTDRDDIELTQKLIRGQAQRLSRYVCGHCGFKARQYYWQCPGCNRWDSYAPRRSEELERTG